MRQRWILAVSLGVALSGCVDGAALRAALNGEREEEGRLDAAAPDRGAADMAADSGVEPIDRGPAGCQIEICNGIDDDCDGQIDEAIAMPCGPVEAGVGQCVAGRLTCRDGLLSECIGSVGPAMEFCDSVDNDCDGRADEGLDCRCEEGETRECFSGAPEQNGVGVCRPGLQACDPERLVFGPCTEEVAPRMEECNGRDDDCDGRSDEGLVDAGAACMVGVGACARPGMLMCGADGRICTGEAGAPDDETCDGRDEDCDGRVDEDFGVGEGCEEGRGACSFEGRLECVDGRATCVGEAGGPGEENVCNAIDDDCDGQVDEAIPCYSGPAGTEGVGRCRGGELTCDNGCVGEVGPRAESCDGRDEDCDGQVDEGLGCQCAPGEEAGCYEGPGAAGVGRCREGRRTCGADHTWGPCQGVVGPAAEICNGADDDCDGSTDERIAVECGTDVGRCRVGSRICQNGQLGVCGGSEGPRDERCDGVDDDCDGVVDEDLDSTCGTDVGRCRRGGRVCRDGEFVCVGAEGPFNETCNGEDDDCDGQTDEGVQNACGGCGAVPAEVCNGGDDDCDGLTDEGVMSPCGGCAPVPRETCNGEDDDCDGRVDERVLNACGACGVEPAEQCNGQDDDCDGRTDEGVQNACGGCGAVPQETCNGEDDDCDGQTDEGGDAWCANNRIGRADECVDGACTCGGRSVCRLGTFCSGGICENECGGMGMPACQ